MITCPWCGTNYLAFQTNCKNCGGPLPAPVADEVQAPLDRLPPPPPPPRLISSSYTWRLMLVDGWGIAAGVLILLGGIFSLVGFALILGIVTALVGIPFMSAGIFLLVVGGAAFYWRYQQALKIVEVLQRGQAAKGQIVSVEVNYAVRINRRNPWLIAYHFQANGQTYQGKVATLNQPGAQLQPGRPAWVLYLPHSPQYNALYPHP